MWYLFSHQGPGNKLQRYEAVFGSYCDFLSY